MIKQLLAKLSRFGRLQVAIIDLVEPPVDVPCEPIQAMPHKDGWPRKYESGHPHAELMFEYARDAKTTGYPWELWLIDMATARGGWRQCK